MPDGLQITVKDKKWKDVLPKYRSVCRRAVSTVLDLTSCEVSIVLADDVFVNQLNLEYRNIDKPTNVLSFPVPFVDVPIRPMGDIVLALETVQREAKEQKKSFEEHLTHLLIHGALHLSGYDHISDEEAKVMESLEIEKVTSLGFANPYEGEIR